MSLLLIFLNVVCTMANTGLGLLGGRFFCIFKYVYKKLAEYGKMSVRLTIIYLHSIHCLSFRLSTRLLTLETFSILVPYTALSFLWTFWYFFWWNYFNILGLWSPVMTLGWLHGNFLYFTGNRRRYKFLRGLWLKYCIICLELNPPPM